MFVDTSDLGRPNLGNGAHSDPNMNLSSAANEEELLRHSCSSAMSPGLLDTGRISGEASPLMMSPWNQTGFAKSSWSQSDAAQTPPPENALIGSLVREEGHIYSLAATGDVLYTGSDSKNIRVWKNLKEFAGFKSSSGLVKAIVISGEKVFTGHQDGKIRIWKVSPKNPANHKRCGTLPSLKDIFKCSIKPSNYVEVRRHRTAIWIKHSDAVSCLSLSDQHGLLYSASWDRTIKVWRLSDSRCLESISAHDDAVNSVVSCSDDLVFTGSADGSVKVWKREKKGKGTKHTLAQTLLKQDSAVTALTVDPSCSVLYCGSSDGLVNFWEREKQLSHGGVLKGHKLAVLCLEAAGNLLFTGSADKTICVWRRDGTIHTCLSVLTGHTGPVKCLAVEKDPEFDASSGADQQWMVYSGSLDKSVKVWRVTEQALDLNSTSMMHQQIHSDMDFTPSDSSVSSSSGGRTARRKG